jgi:hypothetical protein
MGNFTFQIRESHRVSFTKLKGKVLKPKGKLYEVLCDYDVINSISWDWLHNAQHSFVKC